jgi:hypothetical protein
MSADSGRENLLSNSRGNVKTGKNTPFLHKILFLTEGNGEHGDRFHKEGRKAGKEIP